MDERFIALVDPGTSKITLTVAKVNEDSTEVMFFRSAHSEGVRHSRVYNPVKAAACLKKLVNEAEQELGIRITQVAAGLPRGYVRQESAPAQIERSDPYSCITQEEVDILKNMTLDSYPLEDPVHDEIYGAIAQSFSTDDTINATENDIVGMPSEELNGNFKIFVGEKRSSANIDSMMSRLGIAVARKYFIPEAVGRAVLNSNELENGVGLIEFGAGITSISIYQGNILRYYSSIPFGGDSITSDIKYEGSFRTVLAENIKCAFGACQPDRLLTMSEKIIQITNLDDGGHQQLPVRYLSEIITSRVHEIMQAIFFLIQSSGYADKLRAGLVLTGGCANMVNCANQIKEESGYNVRIGFPRLKHVSSAEFPQLNNPAAAASVGMLMIAKDDRHLNCIDGTFAPVGRKEEAAQAPETAIPAVEPAYEAREDGIPDIIVGSRQAGKPAETTPVAAGPAEPQRSRAAEPSVVMQRPEAAEPQEKKAKPAPKKNDVSVRWGKKIVDSMEKAFDKTLGIFYDEMN